MVLPRFMRGKYSEDNQGVTLKVALGDLLGDPVGGKEGRKGVKIGSMSRGEKQSGFGERSFQTHQTLSGASGHERFDKKDEKLECLHRLVRDLELKARGKRRRRDRKELAKGSANVKGGYGEMSHQSSSHRHQDRSREYADWDSISLEG